MPRLINLDKLPSRSRRPNRDELPPWHPGKCALRILEYLYRFRYLTSELLAMVYEHDHGRGRYQVQKHLTHLWRYGLVERFYRPADWGSSQYVYTVSVDGAHLLIKDDEWDEERRRVYNLAKPMQDYEHALAESLIHVLWTLGSPTQENVFLTAGIWRDKEGTKERKKNEFIAQVDGQRVPIQPDLTVLIAHQERGYYRPYFFEIERTHKNYERLRRRFRAYAYLLNTGAGRREVASVFAREGLLPPPGPDPGLVVFVAADQGHAHALRMNALSTVKKDTEIWFTSLDRLLETRAKLRRDGAPCRGRGGKTLEIETGIPPQALFTRQLLVNMDGKPGRFVV